MMVIKDRVLAEAKRGGWIGVDLDGTMFTYDTWVGWNVFGEPIEPMIRRVREWLAAGIPVRIVTARVGLPDRTGPLHNLYSLRPKYTCRVTDQVFSDSMMVRAVQDHLQKHDLPRLPVQCYKDVNMIELWDDRAVQVIPNTGQTLAGSYEAELTALHGKAQGPDTDIPGN